MNVSAAIVQNISPLVNKFRFNFCINFLHKATFDLFTMTNKICLSIFNFTENDPHSTISKSTRPVMKYEYS